MVVVTVAVKNSFLSFPFFFLRKKIALAQIIKFSKMSGVIISFFYFREKLFSEFTPRGSCRVFINYARLIYSHTQFKNFLHIFDVSSLKIVNK